MGVQFDPLGGLLVPHLGKFWTSIEGEYPRCSENPPLVAQKENFDQPGALQQSFTFGAIGDFPRIFFEDSTGNWLIQIQRDRFLHNWRDPKDDTEYPRFPKVRERFFAAWGSFGDFILDNNLGKISVNQLEITYLNRIPLAASRIGEVFLDVQWRETSRFLPQPELMDLSCSFKIPDKFKRLRTSIKPTVYQDKPSMLFELTVRGGLRADESLVEWFDEGRSWIVKAFADLTSAEWHAEWGKTS